MYCTLLQCPALCPFLCCPQSSSYLSTAHQKVPESKGKVSRCARGNREEAGIVTVGACMRNNSEKVIISVSQLSLMVLFRISALLFNVKWKLVGVGTWKGSFLACDFRTTEMRTELKD